MMDTHKLIRVLVSFEEDFARIAAEASNAAQDLSILIESIKTGGNHDIPNDYYDDSSDDTGYDKLPIDPESN